MRQAADMIRAGAALISLFLSSCSPEPQPESPDLKQSGSVPAPAPVPFKDLGWDGTRYTFKPEDAPEARPFTGITTDHYKSGQLKARYQIKDGRYHGLVEEWYENGRQKTKTSYEEGKHQGDNFYWNPDGTLQVHKIWKDDVLVSESPALKP